MLKPHVESTTWEWRANINPSNRDLWFANYGNILNKYADIAKSNNVELYVLGTELISLTTPSVNSTNTTNWNRLIDEVRKRYTGKITYGANWGNYDTWGDEKDHIEFWDKLDLISISAYWPLQSNSNNNVEQLKQSWDIINKNDIQLLQQRTGKKIFFSEIGYRSSAGAHLNPAEPSGAYDELEQKTDYQAFFEYCNNYPYLSGIFLWDWNSDPNYGGPGNIDYSPQNKSAETVIKNWYTGNFVTPGPTSAISASGVLSPAMPTKNSPTSIYITIRNGSTTLQNVIVDIEIYNESNQKVFQKFKEGQTLTTNSSLKFLESWTPTASGKYTLKVGIFKSDWTQNYFWIDSLLVIQVNDSTTTTASSTNPVQSSQSQKLIEVWWPTQNINLSGVQPWKAILQNTELSQYQMFWQVDGDVLNKLYDSSVDYPHKEAIVDLPGWNWKSSKNYTINFVAKDNMGNMINQKSIDVFVNR